MIFTQRKALGLNANSGATSKYQELNLYRLHRLQKASLPRYRCYGTRPALQLTLPTEVADPTQTTYDFEPNLDPSWEPVNLRSEA